MFIGFVIDLLVVLVRSDAALGTPSGSHDDDCAWFVLEYSICCLPHAGGAVVYTLTLTLKGD